MSFFEIKIEPHTGNSCCTVVDAHGISVSIGSGWAYIDLNDHGLRIDGGPELASKLRDMASPITRIVQCAPVYSNRLQDWESERQRRGSVPKELVTPIANMAVELAMKYFASHPDQLIRWLDKIKAESFKSGSEDKKREIQEALGIVSSLVGSSHENV